MKVLPPFYGSVFIQCKPQTCEGMIKIDLWRFKSLKTGKIYLVDVEVYEKNIYGVKFYLKSQAHKKDKYSYQTNDFEPRRIVLSCIYIMRYYYQLNNKSSFAFIGANSIGENSVCTKRFRFYRAMVNTYFGMETFEHHTDEAISTYLLIRKSELENGRINIDDIDNFFRNIYII